MPNEHGIALIKRYMEKRICACGNHEDVHVATYDEMRSPDTINCKLTRDLVAAWNMPPRQGLGASA
jgi:hypothetical protein